MTYSTKPSFLWLKEQSPGAHPANTLAPNYLLTFLYQKTLQVTVGGKEIQTMINNDRIASNIQKSSQTYYSRVSCHYQSTPGGSDIHS